MTYAQPIHLYSGLHLPPNGRIAFEGVIFDQDKKEIRFQGCSVAPTKTTYLIAFYFFSRCNQLCTYTELLSNIWAFDRNIKVETRRIASQVSKVRALLRTLNCPYDLVPTKNIGYRLINVIPPRCRPTPREVVGNSGAIIVPA